MREHARAPRGIDSFNKYIVRTVHYLQEGIPITHAVRLGITEEELKFLLTLLVSWTSLYELYGDKKNSRTTAVIAQLHNIVNQFLEYDKGHHLLDRIASSPNATIVDMEIFNIRNGALRRSARSIVSKPITEAVSAILEAVVVWLLSSATARKVPARLSLVVVTVCNLLMLWVALLLLQF